MLLIAEQNLTFCSHPQRKTLRNGEKIENIIFNREICVCALLATNSFMRKKQRRNGVKYEER